MNALEKLNTEIEITRIRLRAEYAGVDLRPRAPREVRARAVDWIRAGAPVGDEEGYLEWLLERDVDGSVVVAA